MKKCDIYNLQVKNLCYILEHTTNDKNRTIILEEIEDKAPNYSDIKEWFEDLLQQLKDDKPKLRSKLNEKIKLITEIKDKLEEERRHPNGMRKLKYMLKGLIPFNGIYRYFKSNDNAAGYTWLVNAMIPVPGLESVMRAITYKNMINDMLIKTYDCLKFLNDLKQKLH